MTTADKVNNAKATIETLFSSKQELTRVLSKVGMVEKKPNDGSDWELNKVQSALEHVCEQRIHMRTAHDGYEVNLQENDFQAIDAIHERKLPYSSACAFAAVLRLHNIPFSTLPSPQKKSLVNAFIAQVGQHGIGHPQESVSQSPSMKPVIGFSAVITLPTMILTTTIPGVVKALTPFGTVGVIMGTAIGTMALAYTYLRFFNKDAAKEATRDMDWTKLPDNHRFSSNGLLPTYTPPTVVPAPIPNIQPQQPVARKEETQAPGMS